MTAEICTASSFFRKGKQLVLRSGSPVSTLSDFRSKDAGGSHFLSHLPGRFVIWRTGDNHLLLEEHNLNGNLHGNSLSVQIEGAPLLPFVVILEADGQLIILSCSVTTLNCLAFRYPTLVKSHPVVSNKIIGISLPSIFTDGLPCFQVQHNLPLAQGLFPVALTAAMLSNKVIQVAISINDGTILIGNLPAHNEDVPSWDYLRPNSGVKRVLTGFLTSFARSDNPAGETVTDMVLLEPNLSDSFLFTVSLDYKLRIWSTKRKDIKMILELLNYFAESRNSSSTAALTSLEPSNRLRYLWDGEQLLLAISLILDGDFCFVILNFSTSEMNSSPSLITVLYSPATNVELLDFGISERQIWALYIGSVNETICFSASFNKIDCSCSDWIRVDLSSSNPSINGFIDATTVSELSTQIFTPGRFSFWTVAKALKITCRGKGDQFQKEDWIELCAKTHSLINKEAVQIINEKRLTEDSLSYVAQSVWQTFYSNCLQYHQACSKPLGIICHSKSDLVGIIRKEFFSFICPKSVSTFSDFFCLPAIEKLMMTESYESWIEFKILSWPKLNEMLEQWLRNPTLKPTIDAVSLDLQRHSESLLPFVRNVFETLQVHLDQISDQIDLSLSSIPDLFFSTLGCELLTAVCQNSFHSAYRLLQSTSVLVCLANIFKTNLSLSNENWSYINENVVPSLIELSRNYAILCWFVNLQIEESHKESSDTKVIGKAKGAVVSSLTEKPIYKFTSVFKRCLEGNIGIRARGMAFLNVSATIEAEPVEFLFPNIVSSMVGAVREILWPQNSDLAIADYLMNCGQYEWVLEYCKLAVGMSDLEVSLLYTEGCAYLHLQNPDAAIQSFMKASFGIETDSLLKKRLFGDPQAVVCPSDYYLKVMEMFESFNYSDHLLSLAQSCLSVCSDADIHNKPVLWTILFKNYLRLDRVTEAFDAIKQNPNLDSQKNCLRQAVVVFAENRQLHQLISIDYGCLELDMIDIMESRARTADLLSNDYYDFLFSFFVSRRNYRKAGVCMYEFALRLRLEVPGFVSLRRQLECYASCISALSQASDDYRWIVKPEITQQQLIQPGMSPKRDSDGLELPNFSQVKKLTVMTLSDIRGEHLLVKARMVLAEKNVSLIGGFSSPSEIVTALLQEDQFDLALLVSKAHDLSYLPVFKSLTKKCVFCSRAVFEDETDKRTLFSWLEENKMVRLANSINASPTDSLWLLLESYLDRFSSKDSEIYESVTKVILSMDFALPSWLVAKFKFLNMPELLRLLIEYGRLADAHDILIQQIDTLSTEYRSKAQGRQKVQIWLPYSSIDLLLQVLDENKTKSDYLQLFSVLESKLSGYFELIES